jgi:hypothetical protein
MKSVKTKCNSLRDAVEMMKPLMVISQDEIKAVEVATRGQRKSPLWMPFRLGRITASNIKSAVKWRGTRSLGKDFIEKVATGKSGFVTEHMQYGIEHEATAIKVFEHAKKLKVDPCGLVIEKRYVILTACLVRTIN